MVGYAYDIGPRKTKRILTQAMRQGATVWAQTIDPSNAQSLKGNLCESSDDDKVLLLKLGCPTDKLDTLVGRYYQLVINLSEARYLTVSDLIDIHHEQDETILVFNRPENIQVMQRRKFHRQIPETSIPVYISWQETPANKDSGLKTPSVGKIANISRMGMSIKTSPELDKYLFVGDTIHIRFAFNVKEPELFTSAVICHKELVPNSEELFLGVQFISNNQSRDFSERLQQNLSKHKSTNKGA